MSRKTSLSIYIPEENRNYIEALADRYEVRTSHIASAILALFQSEFEHDPAKELAALNKGNRAAARIACREITAHR